MNRGNAAPAGHNTRLCGDSRLWVISVATKKHPSLELVQPQRH